jgi:hypothetical protein
MKTKKRFFLKVVGISLALGMMVIGCDQDGDSGGGGSGPGRVSGTQVYLSDGTEYTGSGTVKIRYYYSTGTGYGSTGTGYGSTGTGYGSTGTGYGSSGTYETAVGSITGGKLSLTLPKIDDQYLSPAADLFGEGTTIKGENIKFAQVHEFIINASNGQTGYLSSNKYYTYFNKACSISGTNSNGVAFSESVPAGWSEYTSSGSQSDTWTVSGVSNPNFLAGTTWEGELPASTVAGAGYTVLRLIFSETTVTQVYDGWGVSQPLSSNIPYTLSGNTFSMKPAGETRTATINGNSFTIDYGQGVIITFKKISTTNSYGAYGYNDVPTGTVKDGKVTFTLPIPAPEQYLHL